MDWTLILLLAATFVTFLLWRRTRALNTAARAAAERAVVLNTFELEPFEGAAVRGFRVLDATGEPVDLTRLNWLEQGLDVLDVDDLPFGADPDAARAFAPGAEVELIPDDVPAGAPEPVSVWDETMTRRCGAVRANQAHALIFRLEREEVGSCIVLQEERAGGQPLHLRLLLVHRDVDVGIAPQD